MHKGLGRFIVFMGLTLSLVMAVPFNAAAGTSYNETWSPSNYRVVSLIFTSQFYTNWIADGQPDPYLTTACPPGSGFGSAGICTITPLGYWGSNYRYLCLGPSAWNVGVTINASPARTINETWQATAWQDSAPVSVVSTYNPNSNEGVAMAVLYGNADKLVPPYDPLNCPNNNGLALHEKAPTGKVRVCQGATCNDVDYDNAFSAYSIAIRPTGLYGFLITDNNYDAGRDSKNSSTFYLRGLRSFPTKWQINGQMNPL